MDPPPATPITAWLSTDGSRIVGSTGETVVLRGFHWFGMEINLCLPMLAPNAVNTDGKLLQNAGRAYRTITYQGPIDPVYQPGLVPGAVQEGLLDSMKRLGFNCLRLSICEDVTWPHARIPPKGGQISINGWLNPDLLDGSAPLTFNNTNFIPAIEQLDRIVDHCRAIGLYVVLDIHSCAPQALYNTADSTHGLWYTTATPGAPGTGVTNTADHIGTPGDLRNEQQWIDALVFLAQRYAANPAVLFDLINEPFAATWDDHPLTGWPAAAERCGAAMQAVNPNTLIIVEGLFGFLRYNGRTEYSSYSGILSGVADRPVRLPVPHKLVYSAHEYPVYNAPRWRAPDYPASLARFWDQAWGNLGVPVFIGEFGGDFRDPASVSGTTQPGFTHSAREEARLDRAWIGALTAYIKRHGASWCYFAVNQGGPGPKPTDTSFIDGMVDYGDWTTPIHETFVQLAPLLEP